MPSPPDDINQGATLSLESELPKGHRIQGANNRLSVGRRCSIRSAITIIGDNNTIEIADRVTILSGWLAIVASGARISIGERTTMVGGTISAHEAGAIVIGPDCQFSLDVFMDVSDMHPIYDGTSGDRINPAKDIVIGEHVWLGLRVIVLKGARIGAGSVAAAGSIVGGEVPERVCVAGAPARVIREDVRWERRFTGI
jgi:acetyltransferase-like isoleucine patch superfamily enzyme